MSTVAFLGQKIEFTVGDVFVDLDHRAKYGEDVRVRIDKISAKKGLVYMSVLNSGKRLTVSINRMNPLRADGFEKVRAYVGSDNTKRLGRNNAGRYIPRSESKMPVLSGQVHRG